MRLYDSRYTHAMRMCTYIWINVCVREYFKQKHARKLIGDFQYEMSYLLPQSPLKVH